jgi:hypothetical protein
MRTVSFGMIVVLALGGAAVAQPAGFEGTYTGPRTVTRFVPHGPSRPCEATHETTVNVRGGAFNWNFSGKEPIAVPVAADGSFSKSSGEFTLAGRISGGHFIADGGGPVCGYHFDLTKK